MERNWMRAFMRELCATTAIEHKLGIDLILVSDQSEDEQFYRAHVPAERRDSILAAPLVPYAFHGYWTYRFSIGWIDLGGRQAAYAGGQRVVHYCAGRRVVVRKAEQVADLVVGHAPAYESHDLTLPIGEGVELWVRFVDARTVTASTNGWGWAVACAIAAVALAQIRSLRSELATLQRDLLPVKERLARLEQIEKTKLSLEQQGNGQAKSAAVKNKAGGEILRRKPRIEMA